MLAYAPVNSSNGITKHSGRHPTVGMAAVHYHSLPIHHRHPQIPIHSSPSSLTKSFSFLPPPSSSSSSRKHAISVAARVADDPSTASPPPSPPEIEIEFLGPKPGVDGTYPVDRVKAKSGEKLLRNIMAENKIELYATYGKVMNCGGGGSCGTCIVEIIDGNDLLNERTNTEERYLKKKPDSWRLACQTIVGNKENAGKVVVQRLPQWKK